MDSTATVRLWLIRETEKARLYSKTPPSARRDEDSVWVPKSVIEHCRVYPSGEHHVLLPDWLIEEKGL